MRTDIAFTAVFLALAIRPIEAATITLPNAQAGIVGNDSSGSLAGSFASGESQDIWDSSQLPSGDLLISQLAFRLKPGTGSINATATSFSLFMSTTSFTPATMTTTFATNRGADYTMVASGAGTLWSSPGCSGSAPCAFDIIYTFGTPFLYNRSKGNLLIEMQITGYNGVGTGEFDVQNYATNPLVGEVLAFPIASTGAKEFSDNITRLTFSQVPEPGTEVLALCGLCTLLVLRQRRKNARAGVTNRNAADPA